MNYQLPDEKGFYGKFGGQFVPETLMTAVIELDKAYREAKADPSFQAELDDLLKNYVGRETPLYHAKSLSKHRWSSNLPETGRPQPHRGSQD